MQVPDTPPSLRVEPLDGGAVWRVSLNTPHANILDRATMHALTRVFDDAHGDTHLKALILEGSGPSFSYGASVQEHLPEACAAMLTEFHAVFGAMLNAAVVTLAAVRGQCLGGGLELAAFCNRVFSSEDARLGQPEIGLGVFAPFASVILPERMGRGAAEDMLLSGRVLPAREALEYGLVDEVCDDPFATALAYARQHLLPRSASSLRWAYRAARRAYGERLTSEMARLQAMYVRDLMSSADAHEGIRAFLEKRPARWEDR